MVTSVTSSERQPTSTISQDTVVLVYVSVVDGGTTGQLKTVTLSNGGTDYAVGDILTITQAGASNGTIVVTSVSAVLPDVKGPVATFAVQQSGTGYYIGSGLSTAWQLKTVTLSNGGTDYAIGDVLTITQAGASGGTIVVTGVANIFPNTRGPVTTFVIQQKGAGYTLDNGLSTTATSIGTGCKVNITEASSTGIGCKVNTTDVSGTLYKRTYEYGAVGWDTVEILVNGTHPDLVDQSGKLWLVWVDGTNIKYANSFDGGITLTPTNTLINNASLPGITTLPNGFTGVACFV